MICETCSIDLPDKDFLLKNKSCYKCVYKRKVEEGKNVKFEPIYRCRECGVRFKKNNLIKVRQRSVYCSQECASAGHVVQNKQYWTKVFNRN